MKKNVLWMVVGAAVWMYPALAMGQATAASPGSPDPSAQAQPTSAAPEAKVDITCVVRTQKGVPVPGATVRAVHIPSGRGWVAWTDQDGKAAFSGLPPGQYRLESRQLGLGTASFESEIAADTAASFEIKLSVNTAPEAVVAAAPKAAEPSPAASAPAAATITTPAATPTADAAGKTTETAAAKAAHHHHGQTKPADASAPATASAPAAGKKKGFEQVETKGQPTASTDVSLDNPLPSAPGVSDQPTSNTAYLIPGTIARGANVMGATADPNASDNSGDDSESDSSKKKHSHSGSGGKHKDAQQSGSSGLSLDELAFNQKMKHLGANRVRFGFYESYGNSLTDAIPFSVNDPNPKKLPGYRERFGANAGGPLVIPHIFDGREKTFFFVDYELDRHTDPVSKFLTVPTMAERGGDLSALGVTLYNPCSSGTPGPTCVLNTGTRAPLGTQIPQQYLDPTAQALLQYIPLPNLPGNTLNYHQQQSLPQGIDKVNTRILHSLSPRTTLLVAYNLVDMRSDQAPMYPTLSENLDLMDHNVTLGVTVNINPRFIAETRFNFSRASTRDLSGFAYTNNIEGNLGIAGGSILPIDWGAPGIGMVTFSGLSDATPELVHNQTFRLAENLSKYFSKHTLRFGGEVRRRDLSSFVRANPRGVYEFSGLMSAQLDANGQAVDGTGSDLADFLMGLPETTTLDTSVASYYNRDWWLVGYFEDDWRIRPRFSIDFGLRYEYVTPYSEKYNRYSTLVLNPEVLNPAIPDSALFGQSNLVAAVQPGQINPFTGRVVPASILQTPAHNLEPRIGIAWRPLNRGPVIRAGYGIFYTGSVYNVLTGELTGQPPFAQTFSPITSPTGLLTLKNGFPPVAADVISNSNAVDPNYKLGYAQIWNVSMEMPISNSTTTEVTYTGTKGTHLEMVFQTNSTTPGPLLGADSRFRIANATNFNYDTSAGNSIYHGVQVRFQRRMAHGVRFLAYYTFSKSIDDTNAIGIGTANSVVQNWRDPAGDRGLSSFDIRHQFRSWVTWELPFGDRGLWLRQGWIGDALSNWRVAPNLIINSGGHITPLIYSLAADPSGAIFAERPNEGCNPNLPASQRSTLRYFNTNCFTFPDTSVTGIFGNAPRGAITGPGSFIVNLELARRLHVGERYRMDVRLEGQNLFNHPNYTNVINTLGASDFGSVTSALPMRTIDLVLRVHF